MAKKKPKLRMTLESEFRVAMPADQVKRIGSEISMGRAGLSVSVPYGDGMHFMVNIHSDQMKDGNFEIVSHADGLAVVRINGDVLWELDPVFDEDMMLALKEAGSLKILCSGVCDSDANAFDVHGNEAAEVSIGNAKLA